MKKIYFFAALAAVTLASCSSDDLADNGVIEGPTSTEETQNPISFNTTIGNRTRAGETALQDLKQYNFGVYAYKGNTTGTPITIMRNFLVGYANQESGTGAFGYSPAGSQTWAKEAGSADDHKSPWFYDVLGNTQYTYSGSDGFYKASEADKMSANAQQALVYWDHAYAQTEFLAYSPYSKDAKMEGKILTAPYSDNFVFGKLKIENSDYDKDIVAATLQFRHINSQIQLAFYSDIPNYRVEVLSLDGDNGTFASTVGDSLKNGIVIAAASNANGTNTASTFKTGAAGTTPSTVTVDFSGETPTAVGFEANGTLATYKFGDKLETNEDVNVTDLDGGTKTLHAIPTESANAAKTNAITVVPQEAPGFTATVTFRITSLATGEQVTVHGAKVYVPASATNWKSGHRYLYVFKITPSATGSTDPTATIDPTDVTINYNPALVPIVFDGVSVLDFTEGGNGTTKYEGTISEEPAE